MLKLHYIEYEKSIGHGGIGLGLELFRYSESVSESIKRPLEDSELNQCLKKWNRQCLPEVSEGVR